jgi:hypothetical protein
MDSRPLFFPTLICLGSCCPLLPLNPFWSACTRRQRCRGAAAAGRCAATALLLPAANLHVCMAALPLDQWVSANEASLCCRGGMGLGGDGAARWGGTV